MTFGSNQSSSNFNSMPPSAVNMDESPPKNKANKQAKTKKEKAAGKKTKKNKVAKEDPKTSAPSSDLTKLDDLPSLGGPTGGRARGGLGRFGGFDKGEDASPMEEDSDGGFDDFDMNEHAFGDSSNKYDDAEKHLRDF